MGVSEPNNRRRGILVFLVAFVLCLMVAITTARRAPRQPIMVLPASYQIRQGVSLSPDRWIPPTWRWYWRVRYRLSRRPRDFRNIQFRPSVFQDVGTPAAVAAKYSLGPPQADSDGLWVWLLPESGLGQLEGSRNLVRGPRAQTANHRPTFTGIGSPAPTSFMVYALPAISGNAVDLTSRFVVGAGLPDAQVPQFPVTNFTAALRAQIPWGSAVVLLDATNPLSVTNRYGFLVVLGEVDDKGNKVAH